MLVLYIILACIALLLLILIVRALAVKDTAVPPQAYEKPQIDMDAALKKVQGAIRIPTISMRDETIPDKPFLDLQAYLEKTFPLFHEKAHKRVIDKYALMYRIEGSDKSLKPAMFMGHQDVVPPQEEGWKYPPFSAEIADGCIWGRGSFDMKSQLVSIFEATEMHLRQGKQPARNHVVDNRLMNIGTGVIFVHSVFINPKELRSKLDVNKLRGVAQAVLLPEKLAHAGKQSPISLRILRR